LFLALTVQSREIEKLGPPRPNMGQIADVSSQSASPGGNKNAAIHPGEDPEKQRQSRKKSVKSGGEAGIRTLGRREGTRVFEACQTPSKGQKNAAISWVSQDWVIVHSAAHVPTPLEYLGD